MTFADLARRASRLAIDNSPTILTSVGVVGVITTAYLAGKASFQAGDIIRLKENDDELRGEIVPDPRELFKQRVELVWRLYIPAVVTGVATVGCVIGANKIGSRRAAGIAAAYAITERTIEEYKTKVVEKLGEKKEQQLHDEVIQDRVNRTKLEDIELYGIGPGKLCFDSFSGRYFYGTVETIRSAVNDINNTMNHDGNATLGDLYRLLDIPATDYSDMIGWNSDKLIDLNITAALFGEDPVVVMDFRNPPGPDYGRFRRY